MSFTGLEPDRFTPPREPLSTVLGALALMTLAVFLILSPILHLSDWSAPITNLNVLEAVAWREGRLHLSTPLGQDPRYRPTDTAFVNGRVYNIFPPFMSFFSYAALTLQSWQGFDDALAREAADPGTSAIYAPWYVLLVFWPLPIAAFWAARESILAAQRPGPLAGSTGCPSPPTLTPSIGAALVAAYWMLGTPLTRLLYNCQTAATNELNHVLAGTGLLLVAGDLVHRRRMWIAAVGLIWAMWSRQLTVFYLLALLGLVWSAWRTRKQGRSTARGSNPSPSLESPAVAANPAQSQSLLMPEYASASTVVATPLPSPIQDAPTDPARIVRRGLIAALLVIIVGGGALATLNTLKFGHPFDTGYAAIYAGREKDLYAKRYLRYQKLFDVRFLPENFYWMNLAPPTIEVRRMTAIISGEGDGTALWITSPLLLLVLIAARSWWRDPARRALMLASFVVVFGFLCYHNTGSLQRGFHRFSMDVVPIWLIVIAPYAVTRRALPFTLACLAYSTLYFHFLCRN